MKLILINTFLYIDLVMPLKVKQTKTKPETLANQKPNHMFKKQYI